MYSKTLLLVLLGLAEAAPSGYGHVMAHRRRERFMTRHAHEVKRSMGAGTDADKPLQQMSSSWGSSKATRAQKLSSPQIHDPNLRIGGDPIEGIAISATKQVDYSGNWCGVVQQAPPANSNFTSVTATWTMPILSVPSGDAGANGQDGTFFGSQWVGIDGYTATNAILQAGTTSAVTVSGNGTVVNTASAWFEWYPDPENEITEFEVSPGDQIECTVKSYNISAGMVSIRNVNTGQTYTKDFGAPNDNAVLEGANAEWIYEDFSSGGLVPFASFTPVTFGGCVAETSAGDKVGVSNGTLVDLVANNDVVCNTAMLDDQSLVVSYGPGTNGAPGGKRK